MTNTAAIIAELKRSGRLDLETMRQLEDLETHQTAFDASLAWAVGGDETALERLVDDAESLLAKAKDFYDNSGSALRKPSKG